MKLRLASEKAFLAVFFFLPISKPLMFIAFCVASILFIASGNMTKVRQSWHTLPWMIPGLILSVLPLLSLLIHSEPKQNFQYFNLSYFWLIALVIFLASSQISITPWIRAFLCGTFIALCYSKLNQYGWVELPSAPLALGNLILFSQFLALGILLFSILYRHERKRHMKALYLSGIAIFFWGLTENGSRSGMLSVLIFLPFIFYSIFGRKNRGKMFAGCLVVILLMALSPKVQQRVNAAVSDLQQFENKITNTSIGYRFEMWRTAWEIFRAHPILGAGPSAFTKEWNKTPQTKEAMVFVEPHNAFAFFASSYGLIGLFTLIWLYTALLWTGWTHRQTFEGSIIFVFAVIFVVGSFTNTMFTGAVSRALIMLFIGLQGSLLATSNSVLQRQKAVTAS